MSHTLADPSSPAIGVIPAKFLRPRVVQTVTAIGTPSVILPITDGIEVAVLVLRSLDELPSRTHQPEIMQCEDKRKIAFLGGSEHRCAEVVDMIDMNDIRLELIEIVAKGMIDPVMPVAVS